MMMMINIIKYSSEMKISRMPKKNFKKKKNFKPNSLICVVTSILNYTCTHSDSMVIQIDYLNFVSEFPPNFNVMRDIKS